MWRQGNPVTAPTIDLQSKPHDTGRDCTEYGYAGKLDAGCIQQNQPILQRKGPSRSSTLAHHCYQPIRDKAIWIYMRHINRLLCQSVLGSGWRRRSLEFWSGSSPVEVPFRAILPEVTVEVAVTLEEHTAPTNGVFSTPIHKPV